MSFLTTASALEPEISSLSMESRHTNFSRSSILTVSQSVEEGTMVDKGTVITVRLNDATKVGIF